MSRFIVPIRDLLGNDRGNIGSEITGVQISTTVPGGCQEFSCKLHRKVKFSPTELYPLGAGFRLDAIDKDGTFWSGRLEKPLSHRGSDGTYFLLTARGWGVNLADQFANRTNTAGTQTSDIVKNALLNLAQQIDVSTVTASGVTLAVGQAINLDGFNAAQQIAWAQQFGDASSQQQVMTVYPDSNSGVRRLTYGPRSTTPDLYTYSYQFETVELGFDLADAANQVDIEYTSGSSTVTVSVKDATLQSAQGFTKVLRLAMPELAASADATQVAKAQLAAVKTFKMSAAGTLRARGNVLFLNSSGQYVPPHRVRAGQVVQFIDIDPSTNPSTLSYSNSCLLVGTSWEEDTQTLTLTPETFASRLEALFGKNLNTLQGVHVV